jgi:hypothetical protein
MWARRGRARPRLRPSWPDRDGPLRPVRENLESFLSHAGQHYDRGLPRHVEQALRQVRAPFARGVLLPRPRGLSELHRPANGQRRPADRRPRAPVPFANTFFRCPSSSAGWRSSKLTGSPPLARIFVDATFAAYRARAKQDGIDGAQCGAVLCVQRFGSLNLNVHFHTLVARCRLRARRPRWHRLSPGAATGPVETRRDRRANVSSRDRMVAPPRLPRRAIGRKPTRRSDRARCVCRPRHAARASRDARASGSGRRRQRGPRANHRQDCGRRRAPRLQSARRSVHRRGRRPRARTASALRFASPALPRAPIAAAKRTDRLDDLIEAIPSVLSRSTHRSVSSGTAPPTCRGQVPRLAPERPGAIFCAPESTTPCLSVGGDRHRGLRRNGNTSTPSSVDHDASGGHAISVVWSLRRA